jgi:membrane associated rhomboid family serine protease
MFPMTPWVKRLLIANIAVFFVTAFSRELYGLMMLYPPAVLVRPWTLVTYMFLHAGLLHLLFNMLFLFFFGPRLESRLGSKGFLWLYFLSGLGGGVFSLIFARHAAVVGASGAILGVLMGFALYWPRQRIYIYGILPIEAWMLVAFYVVASVIPAFNPAAGGNIANFAHLGGLVTGFVFLKFWDWRKGAGKRAFQRKMTPDASPTGFTGDRLALSRWKGISVGSLHELNRGEVLRLLDKAEREGPGSLTRPERDFLDRMSRR